MESETESEEVVVDVDSEKGKKDARREEWEEALFERG